MKQNQTRAPRHFVIADQKDTYYAWPTIARLSNGELLVVVYAGEAHTHSHGKIVLYRSSDNGESWSPGTVVCNTILDDRDPGILVTADDSIIISSRVAWWKGHEKQPFDAAQAESLMAKFSGGYLIRSDDGGHAWTPMTPYPFQPHGPIELQDGSLFAVGAHNGGWAGFLSKDKGDAWEIAGAITGLPESLAVEDQQVRIGYSEPHFAQLRSGRIIVLFRAHMLYKFNGNSPYQGPWHKVAYMWKAFSDDLGRTWSKPEQTAIWGFPPHISRLSDGRLLVTYGRRWHPFGQRAVITADGECFGDEIIIRDDAPDADLGYPASVQIADGSIVTVYYQKASQGRKPCLMGTIWTLPPKE